VVRCDPSTASLLFGKQQDGEESGEATDLDDVGGVPGGFPMPHHYHLCELLVATWRRRRGGRHGSVGGGGPC